MDGKAVEEASNPVGLDNVGWVFPGGEGGPPEFYGDGVLGGKGPSQGRVDVDMGSDGEGGRSEVSMSFAEVLVGPENGDDKTLDAGDEGCVIIRSLG